MTPLADRIVALTGHAVTGLRTLQGGDLSEVWWAELDGAQPVVAKSGPLVAREAAMLRAMAAAGAPVPAVLAVGDGLFIMEFRRENGQAGPGGWAEAGAALARLHATAGDSYGWPDEYAFGPCPIPNTPHTTWPAFWADNRLRPFVPHLPVDLAQRLETLAQSLNDRLPNTPAPALLHGDLWPGNLMFHNGHLSALIDPACYHGDAEVDLAMLTLFGRPELAFFDAYPPLLPGWQERRAIYQLWPALVHLRLFGAGYRGMVTRLLDRAGV